MRVRIEKMGINGEGIGYVNKKPVFVDGALKGEEVEIKIYDERKNYAFAKLVKIYKRNKNRKDCECKICSSCGACSTMHMTYDEQARFKEETLQQSLYKYAHITRDKVQPIVKNENIFGYRNSFKLPFKMVKNELCLGLYEKGSNHFVSLKHCMIHEKDLERIRKDILQVLRQDGYVAYDQKKKMGLRYLIVRGFDKEYQCTIITGKDTLKATTIEKLLQVEGLISLWQSVNTQKNTLDLFGNKMIHLGGKRQLSFLFDTLQLTLSPKSFFQLNTRQAINLYKLAASKVKDNNKLIVEAYCGIGAISLYLHDKAEKIIGIEYISDAISNANKNAKKNKIKNCEFIVGDAAEKLLPISKKHKIDTLVVDPPRSGLDENMIKTILKADIDDIVYISCNPSTLAKNIKELSKKYTLVEVTPVDMFSQSAHVESVSLLSRK